jgi:hypothetical protein
MKQILTLLLISFSLISFSQDSAKVLFIGNSYTYGNNLPSILSSLAESLGDYIYHDAQTMGGATFEVHANNATTYDKINSALWDFVVLQAQSQEPSFPDNQVNTNTLPYAVQLADSIFANNFCSEALFFMTWGRENGDPQWQPISTYDGMQARLRNAYLRFADSVQGAVSPVGMAWKHVRENHPGIQLYVSDGSHPTVEGSYLAACTFYASIFRKPSQGATYLNGVDPTVASQLQAAADLVVLDSLAQWNLRGISQHTQAGFEYTLGTNGEVLFHNMSTKAQTYSWNFGDGQLSNDEHPQVAYNSNGNYDVQLIAMSPCDSDTLTLSIQVNTLGLDEVDIEQLTLLPTGNETFGVSAKSQIQRVTLYDCKGQILSASAEPHIDMTGASDGLYLIHVETVSGRGVLKFSYSKTQ